MTTIRKSKQGLEIRLDGSRSYFDVRMDLIDKLGGNKSFFAGTDEEILVTGKILNDEQKQELRVLLRDEYAIKNVKFFDDAPAQQEEQNGSETVAEEAVRKEATAFRYPENTGRRERKEKRERRERRETRPSAARKILLGDEKPEEAEPQNMTGAAAGSVLIKSTIRGGQRIESDGDIIVVGDVNPGAELLADGSIAVFGKLRGTAHAGAHGNKKACIVTNSLEPRQIRICGKMAIVPRGRDFGGAKIAYLNDNADGIVVRSIKS